MQTLRPSSKLSKNMRSSASLIASAQGLNLERAIDTLQKASFVKFDSTLELSVKLSVDSKQSGSVVRGVASLPHGTGKSIRIAVISNDPAEGADLHGGSELIDEISAGRLDFDVCIATPEMMGQLGRVAKILGPKGLMPNPKLGTVTKDVAQAIKLYKAGQVEFRSDKGGVINCGVGKLSFATKALAENVTAVISSILKAKPQNSKANYFISLFLSSTMGPSIRLDLDQIIPKLEERTN